jgi:hypothetical protein
MPTDLKRKAEEICVEGNAIDYLVEVTMLVQRIVQGGCNIACDYINNCSRHVEPLEDGQPCLIRISVHKARTKPIHIIWDIMHEFGHLLSGKPEKGEVEDPCKRLKREELAWVKAEVQLDDFPTLKVEIADFLAYKDYRLLGYRNAASGKK